MLTHNQLEIDYSNLLRRILNSGESRGDRTGTGTLSIFGESIRIDLTRGFPLLTTKKVPFKAVLSELLWFIEGSGDERRLAEILHGTRDADKKTIWSPNAEATTGSAYKPKFQGDLGRVYGVQWRSWKSHTIKRTTEVVEHAFGSQTHFGSTVSVTHVDQLKDVITKLKTNPTDRRIIMTAWNPGELDQMALPPCHMFVQFYLTNDRRLSAQMYMRSVDVALGLPFNIASYALLVYMIAHVIDATPDVLTICMGDTHIYSDHFDGVREQLSRTPSSLPSLIINRAVTNIDDFKMEDFIIEGYDPQDAIKMRMSA